MGRHDITLSLSGNRNSLVSGFYASTRVETAFGWQMVSELAPGDLVMTKDAGLMPIVTIASEIRQALWSVRVPEAALGNPETVLLPPGQSVLIRSDYALPFSGDDLALVPITALEGWRGITPQVPAKIEPILQLRLDRAGILFVGPGLMAGCQGIDDAAFDLNRLLEWPARPTLPLAAARQMTAHLIADEAGDAFRQHQAAALRPPPNLS